MSLGPVGAWERGLERGGVVSKSTLAVSLFECMGGIKGIHGNSGTSFLEHPIPSTGDRAKFILAPTADRDKQTPRYNSFAIQLGTRNYGARGVMPCEGTTAGTHVDVLWGIYGSRWHDLMAGADFEAIHSPWKYLLLSSYTTALPSEVSQDRPQVCVTLENKAVRHP